MAQRLVSVAVDETEQTLRYNFIDGEKKTPIEHNGKPLIFELSKATALQVRLALHGAKQKTCDGFADAEKIAGGDPTKKRAFIAEVINGALTSLYAAIWSEKRGEGEEETPAMVIAAIATVFGKDLAKVQAAWPKLPDEQKKALRADAKVKAEVARIRAERAKAKADAAPAVVVNVEVFD